MSYNFRVGQKVVCVDPKNTNTSEIPELIYGAVYTIRGKDTRGSENYVHLEEVRRNIFGYVREVPFYAKRFRPAIDRKTDISELQKLLVSNKELA
jgi:hypothetical protein